MVEIITTLYDVRKNYQKINDLIIDQITKLIKKTDEYDDEFERVTLVIGVKRGSKYW